MEWPWIFRSVNWVGGCGRFQREEKGCALVHGALGPCATAVPRNNAAHIGQANASPFKLVSAVQPLKDAEQFLGLPRIESDAIVAHEKNQASGINTRCLRSFTFCLLPSDSCLLPAAPCLPPSAF